MAVLAVTITTHPVLFIISMLIAIFIGAAWMIWFSIRHKNKDDK